MGRVNVTGAACAMELAIAGPAELYRYPTEAPVSLRRMSMKTLLMMGAGGAAVSVVMAVEITVVVVVAVVVTG